MKVNVGDIVVICVPQTHQRPFLGMVEHDGITAAKFDGGMSIWAKPPHIVPLEDVENPEGLEVGRVATFTVRNAITAKVVETYDSDEGTIEVVKLRYVKTMKYPRQWASLIDQKYVVQVLPAWVEQEIKYN